MKIALPLLTTIFTAEVVGGMKGPEAASSICSHREHCGKQWCSHDNGWSGNHQLMQASCHTMVGD